MGNAKKEIPKLLPQRAEMIVEITNKIMELIEQEYRLSAQDFLQIIENTKNEGLRRFKL